MLVRASVQATPNLRKQYRNLYRNNLACQARAAWVHRPDDHNPAWLVAVAWLVVVHRLLAIQRVLLACCQHYLFLLGDRSALVSL